MAESLIQCATLAECGRQDGECVEILGTYTVWDPLPYRAKDHPPAQQVQIILASGEPGPYLGAWGSTEHDRPLDEIRRFSGHRVLVTGRFLSAMPKHPEDLPQATRLDGACIHPVNDIREIP